jgi:hypothetical protein
VDRWTYYEGGDVFDRGVNQGFELSPRVLELMGRRGITLSVDIFCEPDEVQRAGLQERFDMRKTGREAEPGAGRD